MKVIQLSADQAAQVAGTGAPGTELVPVPYAPGGFILGLPVLDDPAHADVHDFLAALPQVEYVAPPPDNE